MTTELAEPVRLTNGPPKIEGIERALIDGDLSHLTEGQRLSLYNAKCKAAKLDPLTQPFAYITLKGKLTLYALKTASDQLIAIHRLSVDIEQRGYDRDFPGVYICECKVKFPHGQEVSNIGAVWISDRMFGEELCNAIMKAVTKAIRRTVLSACGLGMLDESEIETIPGSDVPLERDRVIIERPRGPAIVHEPTNEPRAELISDATAWLRRTLTQANDVVRNHFVIENKLDLFKPLANEHQVKQEMVTRLIKRGDLEEASILKPNGKRDPQRAGAALQVHWHRDPATIKSEVYAYLVGKTVELFKSANMEMPEEMSLGQDMDDDASQATADDD